MKKLFAAILLAAAVTGCGPKHASFVKAETAALGRVVVYRNGVAFYERKAVVTGKRAARTAGNRPPMKPIASAHFRPLHNSAGVTLNSKLSLPTDPAASVDAV